MTGDRPGGAAAPSDLIQSLQRGLHILEYVGRSAEPVTARQIAETLDLKVSTAHHLVNTLVYEGYLARGPERRLTLARPISALDERAVAAAPLPIRRALARAAHSIGDTALTAAMRGGEAVVTATESAPGGPSGGLYPVGSRHLPHLSAVGQCLLASDPNPRRRLRDVHAAAAAEGKTIDEQELAVVLERVRRSGVAIARGHAEACIAVPVLDDAGAPLGALALVVTPSTLERGRDRLAATAMSAGLALRRSVSTAETTRSLA